MKKHLLFASFFFTLLITIQAAEPLVWTVNSKTDVLRGDARGVSIDDAGTISLAPRLNQVYNSEQSYVWSSAVDASGNFYLGTGADGKIFRVDAAGRGALFADLNELNVAALAVGRNGELYAGTSPDGRVYQIGANGAATPFFDPKEKYIWSLAVLADGSLAVGTGENGRIYRVRAANAAPEASLLFDTSETHIISLTVDRQGNLYAGTDANGLVLRFGPDGRPFALLDSPLREIHELAIGPDGSVYALALGDSTAAAAATTAPATTPAAAEGKTVSVEKTVSTQPEQAPKSRYDLSSAKSAVYRILPDGGSDIIWSSPIVSAFSIYAHQSGNGVLLGTSDKGRIYSVTNDGRETLVLQSDEGQISTIRNFGQNLFATSSNQGRLFRFGAESVAEGTYESAVLDAKTVSSWGRIWWRANGNVQLQTRSGNTEKPDETWSAWSAAQSDARGAQIASPRAKYLQWRAVLRGAASLSEVNVAFLERNVAPEVLSVQVLPTNVGLAANPPIQIDPNIELSGLDPSVFGIQLVAVPPRRVYQRGATSLQWTAEDRNGDRMVYDVFYREASETAFKPLKENLTETFHTIDGQSLADGNYVFKVVARDTLSNPAGQSLTGERLTEPVAVDNTAPTVTVVGQPSASGNTARVSFEAADAASFISRAEYSVNGGEWRTVYPEDGISDSPRERFAFEIALPGAGEYAVTLRVFDVNGNSGNARATVRR